MSEQEIKARKIRKITFADKKGGAQAIKRALDGSEATPLACLQRDQPGPSGQPVGSFATNPKEVDGIARRA